MLQIVEPWSMHTDHSESSENETGTKSIGPLQCSALKFFVLFAGSSRSLV